MVIEDEKVSVDDLIEKMCEHFEDDIQSIDIVVFDNLEGEPYKAVAKKEKQAEEVEAPKKEIPLDALQPSQWNFFDFKNFMVNHNDLGGAGMKALKD